MPIQVTRRDGAPQGRQGGLTVLATVDVISVTISGFTVRRDMVYRPFVEPHVSEDQS